MSDPTHRICGKYLSPPPHPILPPQHSLPSPPLLPPSKPDVEIEASSAENRVLWKIPL